jgi:hypothetical protein
MLSYVYFGTNDLERATRFYDATLAPLGMPRCITGDPEWDRISAARVQLNPTLISVGVKVRVK